MKTECILFFGGYEGVGRSLSRLMLKETDVNLIVADWRKEKAQEFVGILDNDYSCNIVSARYANAADSNILMNAFQGANLVMVITTTSRYLKQIVESAVNNKCDYLDVSVQQNTKSYL